MYLMMGNSRKFIFHKKQRYDVLWIGSLIYLFNLLGLTVTRVSWKISDPKPIGYCKKDHAASRPGAISRRN